MSRPDIFQLSAIANLFPDVLVRVSKRRYIAIALIIGFSVTVTACGSSSNESPQSSTASTSGLTPSTQYAGGSGVYFGGIPDNLAYESAGVRLGKVVTGSPAEKAGLRAGDVIMRVGMETIGSSGDLLAALRSQPTGEPVEITYLRQGKEYKAEVVLAPSW